MSILDTHKLETDESKCQRLFFCRPRDGGLQFQFDSQGSFESELKGPELVRHTRNQQAANEVRL